MGVEPSMDKRIMPRYNRATQLPQLIQNFIYREMGMSQPKYQHNLFRITTLPALLMVLAGIGASPASAQKTEAEMLQEQLNRLETQQEMLRQEIERLKAQITDDESVAIEDDSDEGDEVLAVESSDRPQGMYLSAEVLFFEPNPSDVLDFAIADDSEALAVGGDLAIVDYHDTPNTRVAVGYRKEDVDVRATWLNVESDGSASAERPDNGFLFSTLSHPSQNDRAETAEAETTLEYTTTDLEVGYALELGEKFDMRLFSGVRFVDTDQDLAVEYDGVDFTDSKVLVEQDFAGFGPRVGADARWLLGSGFSVFGRASGSLVMGDRQVSYLETDNNGEDTVADFQQQNSDEVMPVAEMALGFDWTRVVAEGIGLSLSAGYEYQNWFNAYGDVQFVDAANPGLFTESKGDMTFQGFFVRSGLSLNF